MYVMKKNNHIFNHTYKIFIRQNKYFIFYITFFNLCLSDKMYVIFINYYMT